MSERQKPHNGRDTAGNYKVRQADFNDKLADPNGADYVADDVRLGGAVADTGFEGGQRGEDLQRQIDKNRECVDRYRNPDAGPTDHR